MRSEIAREDPWGRELETRTDWWEELAAPELDELHHALERPGRESLRLCARLEHVAERLESGPGVALLRGLPVDSWSSPRAEAALSLLGGSLGTAVSQSATGERIFHVRDEGHAPDDPRFRGPSSNHRLRFHTDRCDVIGFLCLRPALEGGESHVVSSPRIHEELARRRPDLLEECYGEFPYLRHVVDRGNALPYVMLPVFSFAGGRFAGHLLRVLIDRADLSEEAPSLGDAQREALELIDEIADERELQLRLRLEAGDLLLLNNWTTFHRRTGFLDAESQQERRHLLRIWLSMPNSRPVVEAFRDHLGACEAGAVRGGMREAR